MGDLPDETSSNNSQAVIDALTLSETMELSNLRAMRRSLASIVDYMEGREGAIFAAARTRLAEQGGPVND